MLADHADQHAVPARSGGGHHRRKTRGRHHAARRRRPLAYGLAAAAAAAAVVMISVGVGAAFARPVHRAPVAVAETDPTPVPTRSAPSEASRSDVRSPAPPAAVPQVPARPRPVAGLSQPQMDNAAVIVGVGRSLGLPVRAHLVALSTALQESGLRVLANPTVPESLRYPHQGVEADYDSVGLFQQRATQGWGPVALLMDPVGSTRLFYQRLVQVPGWQSLTVTAAAQAVQRSAFPDAYAGQQARAQQVLDAL